MTNIENTVQAVHINSWFQDISGVSQRGRTKRKEIDERKKCPNNPDPHLLQAQKALTCPTIIQSGRTPDTKRLPSTFVHVPPVMYTIIDESRLYFASDLYWQLCSNMYNINDTSVSLLVKYECFLKLNYYNEYQIRTKLENFHLFH